MAVVVAAREILGELYQAKAITMHLFPGTFDLLLVDIHRYLISCSGCQTGLEGFSEISMVQKLPLHEQKDLISGRARRDFERIAFGHFQMG